MKPLPFSRPACLLIAFTILLPAACKPAEKPEEAPAASQVPAADAFLILPGDYAQKTTVADLESRFGVANVRRETTPEPRVVLFPDDPARRAIVTFHEADAFKELARISVTDPGSRWRGKHGVHVGMTFAKLRELNGKPFYYQGFDELRRGWIHDGWSPALGEDDAALGAFDVGENEHLYFDIELGLGDPSRSRTAGDLPADDRVSSDDPRFPLVGEIIRVTGISASSSLDDEWE